MSDELAPIEYRTATVGEVDFDQRIITVVAVPYGETALAKYRSEIVEESHERGAYAELRNLRPGRVKANRDHHLDKPVGRVMSWDPDSQEGLVAETRVSRTLLGDETLALAADDVLAASLGFFIRGGNRGHRFESRNGEPRRRYVTNAGVHHLAFTADPAFTGAAVVSVRDTEIVDAADLPPAIHTPALDEWTAYLASRRAGVAS